MKVRLLMLSILLGGCSAGPPQTIGWTDVDKPQPLHKKRVILEGYPGVSAIAETSHKGYQQCSLFDTPAAITSSANKMVTLVAVAGSGPNQVEKLPDPYKPTDLKVHCKDGSVATTKDKIRVQGIADVPYGGLYIRDIESIELVK